MDQLKQAFSVLRKYHFWILCGLIVLLYVGVWFTSTSNMSKATESRVSAISSSFSTGDRIAQIQNHPNTSSAEMMKELNRAEAEQVRLAWELRYREQEDVLVWPEELLPDFIQAAELLKPIEAKLDFPTPPAQELKVEFRNRYRDYIRKELPKLAEIIGAEWILAGGGAASMMPGGSGMGGGSMMPGDGMMSGMGGGGSMMPGMMGPGGSGYPGAGMGGSMGMDSGGSSGRMGELVTADGKPLVVVWSPSNQTALQSAFMNWTSPTTLQILYAQEDLWVLRSLMLIIKATNGDADAQYNAAVKEITSIELGAMAAGIKSTGSIGGSGNMGGGYPGSGPMMGSGSMMPGDLSGGSGSSYPGMTGPGGSSMIPGDLSGGSGSSYPGMTGPGGSSLMGSSMDPASGRYVDDKSEPLAGDRLRAAIKSNTSGDAFLAVAKRMPMRMRVRMNVLKLPLLLCEFSQAKLPVEVRQVRINTPAGSSGGFGGPSQSGSGGFGSGGMPQLGLGSSGSGGGPGTSMNMSPDSGSGGGSAGMGSGGLSGAMGGMPGLGGMSGSGGNAAMGNLNAESPYDATVDIYGIIYIYNPVDPAKLGIETKKALEEATPGGADSTDGTATADGTAAAAGETPAGGAAADAAGPADADGTVAPANTSGAPSGAADGSGGAAAPDAPADPTTTPGDGTASGPETGDGAIPAPPSAESGAPSVE